MFDEIFIELVIAKSLERLLCGLIKGILLGNQGWINIFIVLRRCLN